MQTWSLVALRYFLRIKSTLDCNFLSPMQERFLVQLLWRNKSGKNLHNGAPFEIQVGQPRWGLEQRTGRVQERYSLPNVSRCFATQWNGWKTMSIIRVCEKTIPKLLRTVVIFKTTPKCFSSSHLKARGILSHTENSPTSPETEKLARY